MSGPMYASSIAEMVRAFTLVEKWMDKAEEHAAARKFDVNTLVQGRLAPDMMPFSYQITGASDYLKLAAARYTDTALPSFPDTETTFQELRERIRKTVAFVQGIDAAAYEHAGEKRIGLTWTPGKVLSGPDFLYQITIPNFYFHIMAAYLILRHNGVDIGKMDFLGQLTLMDA